MKEKIKKLRRYPFLVVFVAFMLVVFCADMLTTRRQYSELENRTLKQRPDFSLKSLVENEYTLEYEEFVNDQFVLRDQWITLKSVAESALGKIENNGVAYGKEHYLFGKTTQTDQQQVDRNVSYVNQFISGYDGDVTFGVIPNSYAILTDKLPVGLENINIDQKSLIPQLQQQVQGENLNTLELLPVMESHSQEEIYYHTDHHWTTLGAWYAYEAYAQSRGLAYGSLEEMEAWKQAVPDFYGTYFSKSKNFDAQPDTIYWYDFPVTDVTIDGKYTLPTSDGGEIPVEGMYNVSQFSQRDKYAAFLYGNNGLTVIKSENNKNHQDGVTSRVLLIKDSYGNSLAPFLTWSYDEVYVVDLRALPMTMSQLLEQTEFDDVLILYNYESFRLDRNVVRLIA